LRRNLIDKLNERWAAYRLFYREGAIYSAFVRLSEIANCLQHGNLPSTDKGRWADALRVVEATPNDLLSIGGEAKQQIERVRRMLGTGTDLIYEEALLIVTVRTELELVFKFLSDRGVSDLADASSLDHDLNEILRSPKSSAVFRSAQAAAKKNWGLPLHSRWLSSDAVH
jgi:hypothetical protein